MDISWYRKPILSQKPWIEDRKDGTYVVQFVCATPGKYDINAYVDGMPLPMCPVSVTVVAGLASPAHSELYGDGTKRCDLGGRQEFLIQARDEFGNACDAGGARFGVRAVGHAKLHEVADNEDGTYAVVYSVPEYAKGSVKLEVLLDGVPVKNSPVCPQVNRPPDAAMGDQAAEGVFFGPGLSGQLERLRWLRQNPPAEVPLLPPPPVGSGALSTQADAAKYNVAQATGDTAAARLAWRAADEWRRLGELRSELARTRENLMQHQAVLVSVGEAVHREYAQLEEKRRGLEADKQDITEVETRLDWFRADLTRQYKQQQRWVNAGLDGPSAPGRGGGGDLSPQRGRGGGEFSPRRDLQDPSQYDDDIGGGTLPPQQQGLEQREVGQLQQLQEEVDKRRRWLRDLEEAVDDDVAPSQRRGRQDTDNQGRAVRLNQPGGANPLPPPAPPPLVPPLVAPPPPDQVSELGGWRGGAQRGPLTTPPPPAPPPRLDETVNEPASEPRAGSPQGRNRQGMLRTPPPPPSPPPPIVVGAGIGGVPQGGNYGGGRSGSPGPASPSSFGQTGGTAFSGRSPAGGSGASPEELGQAMRKLFHAFASRATGPVNAPRGGRAGRVALGLQDFVRLAGAANLRLPQNELMAAFYATLSQYSGGPLASDGGDQSLPFELFVELLVETARRKYAELNDTESTAALFEEHLLPLSRRLRELEGTNDPAAGLGRGM